MKNQTAIFAAGCFWGVQFYFDEVPGVVETTVGYIGGHKDNPTYWEVAGKKTGHAEAVKIVFDPGKISYDTLLRHFFRMHDPTQLNRQGPDIGDEYRSAIFYIDDSQKAAAQKMIDEHNKYKGKGKVVTRLEKATIFWPAEAEHQKFSRRTGIGMCYIPYAPV
jgi:peptide methionine sulfoxide reductase msrA/msrB